MGYHEAFKKAEQEMKEWTKDTFEEEYTSLPGDYYNRYTDKPKKQVGGTHYQMAIEPIDYIVKNDLGYREGNVIKYITRYKKKNGQEDLLKAMHYLEMILGDYNNE